jgi:hypothetical protein|tara:strand:- start:226 stop:603 length:378 start_codon:yes stop_codon:yes gene_type:complete
VEIANRDLDPRVANSCKHVERKLRLAISDWYYWLSRMALANDTWLLDCEWWMKQVPSQLDMPWAFDSLETVVRRPQMLDMLVHKVDQVCLSMDRTDGLDYPSSIHELRDSLESLRKGMEDAGMAV